MRDRLGKYVPRALLFAGLLAAGAISLLAVPAAHAQGGTVVGQVTDGQSKQGIAGASLQIEGTRIGAITDQSGNYRIANVPAGGHVIVARRLGYVPGRQTVAVTSQEVTANFLLQSAATSLDQVIVTGTVVGEQRRSVGNAVATINATEALSKSAAPNVSSLIGARAPGVTIAQNSGRLGAGPSIQIRGRSSIGLDNSPLLYIDGVRVNNATALGPGNNGGASAQGANFAGRLNDIDPNDIESIEIIKGPAASTIYGTEAANGVIQIITKKGASGKTRFSLQVQNGSIFFRDAADRIATNYAQDASGNIVPWNAVRAESDSGRTLFKTGQTRSYTASLSGGRDAFRYYVSSAYENDLGVEPNNSLRQFTAHANLNASPTSRLDFGTSLNFVSLSNHLGADYGFSSMFGAEFGHILAFPSGRGFFGGIPPEVPQTLYDNADGVNRFTGSETINHRPTDWFTQRVIVGIDYTGDDSRGIEHFAPPELAKYIGPVNAAGRIAQTLRHNSIISADYSGSADFHLTSALSSTSSIGGQFYRTELNSSFLGGIGFPGPGVETVSAAAQPLSTVQGETINTTIGAYGQQQFGWNDRLFVTAALRVDNNSAFGEDFKWVTYPKVSASWVLSEEPFWHLGFVNTLKLRAAYGESGRQPAAFSALRTYSPAQGRGGASAVTPGSIGNANLRPERGKEIELGFDSHWFNRLELDFTYFSKKTEDEIVSQPNPPSSGFPGSQFANLGRVDNHGVEAQATLQAITRENFAWEISGNIGTNKDVLKDLGGLPDLVVSAGQHNVVGGPIGGFYARRVVSADRNPNGTPSAGFVTNVLCDDGAGGAPVACSSAPFLLIGTPTPKYTGSVGNTFTLFKNLRLYASLDFKGGNRLLNFNREARCQGLAGVALCRENYYPKEFSPVVLAETVRNASALGTVDQYYQDASFMKLREVSVTYTLPESFLKGFSRASITLAGRELHTWTNYGGLDPEVNAVDAATSAGSLDQAVLPPLSRFIASINLTF